MRLFVAEGWTPEAEFDARQKYTQNLMSLQQFLVEARVSKDSENWFQLLDSIFNFYSMHMKGPDRDSVLKLLDDINNILHPQEEAGEPLPETIRRNMAFDLLRKAERDLFIAIDRAGLLIPKKRDPRNIVADSVF